MTVKQIFCSNITMVDGGDKMTDVKLHVQGMSCEICVMSIERALREIGAEAKADLDNGEVTISYDSTQHTLETLKAAIVEEGFQVI